MTMNKDGQCPVCARMHNTNEPCPQRIANAYTMQREALQKLTWADRVWMAEHPTFSVTDVVEDAVLALM